MKTTADTIVIGAGAAGLMAASTLEAAGHSTIVLEATERAGGRIHTDREFTDHPVELGAEFIHGDRALTWELVRQLGLRSVHWPKQDDSLVRLENGEWLTMKRAREQHPDFDITRSWDLPRVDPLPNEDWHSYLVRIGFDRHQLRYVQRSFANAAGEAMRFLSAEAMLDAIRGEEELFGTGDYRLPDGYDLLTDHLAAGLDIRFDDPVTHVRVDGDGVLVTTLDGVGFRARSAVIAVPLGVLQADMIHFEPELSDDKHAALFGLRMGPVIKLIYRFRERILPEGTMAVYSALNPPMWWTPSAGRDTTGPVWSALVSGEAAMDLLSLGEQGALEAGLEALREELGRPDLQADDAQIVNWPERPYTRGGYSVTLPGHEGSRELLAEPTPPLYWAGEASAPEHSAATVGGALASGRRAAAQVLQHEKKTAAVRAEGN